MADPLLIQELRATQTSNYVIAVGGALVAYDQILTFSQEASISVNYGRSCMANVEETTVELYNRLIPYRPSLWINKHGWKRRSLCINRTDSVSRIHSVQANIFILLNSKKVFFFLIMIYALHAITVFIIEGLLMSNRVMREHYTSIGPAIGSVVQNADFDKSAFFFPPASTEALRHSDIDVEVVWTFGVVTSHHHDA
ncbi:hypothetical protein BJ138DRAFT_1190530 [Hygrophoropsis aurantiaca]|uniref:Uncharacterized protein n=1 Tax=Hygrophoropsis aurantiaca TaxID=72124 RepID=A0ACB7ZSQ3_9AGAM|nr:hypothetical protein BJ138DRAFT_1190530 [Hygrophoropsis aurantiaca]